MPSSTNQRPRIHWLILLLLFAFAYVGCAELGHWLSFDGPNQGDHFSTCWPPAGLFVATLLLVQHRFWPFYLVVGFLAGNVSSIVFHQCPVTLSATLNFADLMEAVLGAWLVQHIVARPFAFRRLDDVFALISGSAVISTAFAASFLAAILKLPPHSLPLQEKWYRWLLSDMIGVLVVAPLLLAWLPLTRDSLKISANRAFEAALLFVSLAVLGFLVFFYQPNFARAFILFPILIFVAMRFGLKGATAATTLIALFAIWGTTRGTGVFATIEYSTTLIRSQHLQVFLAAASLTALLFSTTFAERLQSDRAMQHHLELLNAVLEGTTDAVFVKDMEGRYLMINEAGAQFMGKTAKEVIGKDDFEMFSTESATRLREIDCEVMFGGQTKVNEEVLTAGNVTRSFQSSKNPYRGSSGELLGLLGISRDVTEYRRAAAMLRESEERFQQMAQTIPEFFWLRQVDPFKFLYASPAYERITGQSVETLYQDPFSFLNFIHPDDRQRMVEISMMEVTVPMEADCRAVRPGGEIRYMRISFSPVIDDSGKIDRLAGIAVDVTELTLAEQGLELAKKELEDKVARRTRQLTEANDNLKREILERARAEEKLQQQQAQLAHISRLSTIGEMAAELAHEINQPLSAIGNYIFGTLHGLQVGDVVSADMLATLNQLKDQSGRAAGIMRRIRNFTRRTDPQRIEFSLNDSVNNVFRLTSAEARHRQIDMQIKLDENLPKILLDPLQIEQVIVNLVRNAFDAVQDVGVDPRVVILKTHNRGGSVEVAVHDNGTGIPDDKRERIFEAFFTTKADGLGLGLAISRTIIEAHQGRLWVEPRFPRGTTFRFSFPIASVSTPVAKGQGPCT